MSTRAPPRCPYCDSEEIDHDPARGDAVCVDCGAVLEESVIVAEVGFSEDARGRASAVGQHVSAQGRPNSFSVFPAFSREATELTIGNGRRRIWHLVSALRLASRHAEAALRLFRLAVERNFHKGRRMANVCCACLYVVVRIERTPHMLIDFSDILETNVYVLGHTFLKFAQILNIELPIIDPSLYIHRFASKLEFGDKTHAVAMSALRLLARMRRDWMSYGRRPNGLCGAALIIASRMHNFYRSQSDVVRVVRIGNVALRDRLQEIDKTPTALLTSAQIDAGGGDDGKVTSLNEADCAPACDPPSFRRPGKLKRGKIPKKSIKDADNSRGESGATTPDAGKESLVVGGINISIKPGTVGRTEADAQLEKELAAALSNQELQELEMESREEAIATAAKLAFLDEKPDDPDCLTPNSLLGKRCRTNETSTESQNKMELSGKERLGSSRAGHDGFVNMDDELSDLDDEDVESYLNTEEEYKIKEAVWMEVNRDYLEKQAQLEKLKRENPEEFRKQRPWRASKKKKELDVPVVKEQEASFASPLHRPKPKASSRKINYSVLRQLRGSALEDIPDVRPSAELPPLHP